MTTTNDPGRIESAPGIEAPDRRVASFSAPIDEEELEFIQALDEYKRKHERPFPSWSEVLHVLKNLGYSK